MALYITPTGRIVRRNLWAQPAYEQEAAPQRELVFPVNVKVGADDFLVTALLPGVKAEDLSIQVLDETVTIQGELKDPSSEDERYLLRESSFGRFSRVIRLPEALDPARAEANLSDGVLTLRVPKADEAKPRTIKVQAR